MTNGSLLLVDDDAAALEYMALACREEAARIRTARDGVEALLAMESEVPDLVVTDLRMPRMDGLELLGHVGRRWPGTPVIVMTVDSDVATIVDVVRGGAADYLIKPTSPGRLRSAVRQGVRRSPGLRGPDAGVPELIGSSEAMVRIRNLVALAARSHVNVLITGATGTGKELVARAIHRLSSHGRAPFVAQNCALIPPDLFESLFLGHRRGSFTGADRDSAGLLEQADHGTLFLDELECLGLAHQARLLRILDDGEIRALGGTETRTVSARTLAATNRDPREMLRDASLREDLYYRLRGFEIHLPPLRERIVDIGLLSDHVLSGTGVGIGRQALDLLCRHSWPGNVRELRNALLGAAALGATSRKEIGCRELDIVLGERGSPPATRTWETPLVHTSGLLEEAERAAVAEALRESAGNRSRAARRLGIDRSTLRRRLRALGLEGP